MAKIMTLEKAKEIATNYIVANKIGVGDYTATRDTLTGILTKIGLMANIVSPIQDTMPELEGEYLPLGKNIEEWFEDLTQPEDYDETGSKAFSPSYSSYRPTVYSYDLGRKIFKKTIPNNKFEPLSLTQADLIKLTNSTLERLYSSKTLYRNILKMELLRQDILKVIGLYNLDKDENKIENYSVGEIIKNGTYLVKTAGSEVYVAVRTFEVSNDYSTSFDNFYTNEVANGNIVKLNLKEQVSRPSQATPETVREFLVSLDTMMIKTKRASEGNSLSGNTLGVQDPSNLTLYVADDILPTINAYKSTIPSSSLINFETQVKPLGEFVEVDDGTAGLTTYAVLVDTRGVKLHNTYSAVRTDPNGEGDFENYILHDDNTAHISPNTFIHIWEN